MHSDAVRFRVESSFGRARFPQRPLDGFEEVYEVMVEF